MALRELGATKAQALPVTYGCTDGLTTLTSTLRGTTVSKGRLIPGANNSFDSGQSMSPISSISITGSNCRQVVSSSAPASSLDMETLVRNVNQDVGSDQDFYRERRKKDIHNMIERRRRYNINDRIKELGLMLPKSSSEELKLNKGTILKASCDYIRQLQKDRELMLRQQQYQARLEQAARMYADRVKELENHLQKNGIAIPPASVNLPPIPLSSFSNDERSIKQEPFDEIPPSPSHTPSNCINSTGFVSQLTDTTAAISINSPVSSLNNRRDGGSFLSGADNPYSTNFAQSNTSALNSQQQGFPDLIMDDLNTMRSILQDDPMISAAGTGPSPSNNLNNQLSPDILWDHANFSPDNQHNQTAAANTHQQTNMDYHQQSNMDFT
ncbi:Helix-loop-helix DNA-binding domain protein [Onchocerca flexuosa]|uniref:Helix-loop-helix DNA-binding domain protein n=3 Tax=Onchocerca flexuosa TaxID=387005 RepID=A0A238BZ70_9BILA|nr:Helix-loop-helix DNA-binding domain protein [Onchocerca flexuosa]